MTYLLDTNICIYGMKNRYKSLTEKLLTIHPQDIWISSVTVAELEYGAAKSEWSERTRIRFLEFLASFQIVDFTVQDSRAFGEIRSQLESVGTPIGPYDLMIAAQAIAHDHILVTHNVKEFDRIKHLQWEDWTHDE